MIVKERNTNKEQKQNASEAFVPKAMKIHGEKYKYDRVKYDGCMIDVDIFCVKCEKFFPQAPSVHLKGHGCPGCVNKTECLMYEKLVETLHPQGLKVTHMGGKISKGVGRMDIRIELDNDKNGFIELDGVQHFEDVEIWESNAIDVQKRDLNKHRMAIDKGYWIVRIDQEWVWNSYRNGETKWIERLNETILKLASNEETSIDEMFLSNKINKYHEHLCYKYEKSIIT